MGFQAYRSHGFTLLEVMVALAVLAFALAAMIKGTADNASNAAYLRDKTLAHWVGMNIIAEQRLFLNIATNDTKRGEEEMGNHIWYWTARLSETFDEDVRRLDVMVSGSDKRDATPLVNLVAFIDKPESDKR